MFNLLVDKILGMHAGSYPYWMHYCNISIRTLGIPHTTSWQYKKPAYLYLNIIIVTSMAAAITMATRNSTDITTPATSPEFGSSLICVCGVVHTASLQVIRERDRPLSKFIVNLSNFWMFSTIFAAFEPSTIAEKVPELESEQVIVAALNPISKPWEHIASLSQIVFCSARVNETCISCMCEN